MTVRVDAKSLGSIPNQRGSRPDHQSPSRVDAQKGYRPGRAATEMRERGEKSKGIVRDSEASCI
jgi:hypothetical protein